MVVDRQRSSESVQAATETHQGKMASQVAAAFGDPGLEAAVGRILKRGVATLVSKTEAMVAADDAHGKELGEDSTARETLESAADALHRDLVDLRAAASSVLGAGYVRTLGFDGATPDDPVAVERLGQVVAKNLSEVPPPEEKLAGFRYDPAIWIQRIREHLSPVTRARAELQREKRESEGTLVAKQSAIAEYDRTFSHTATLVSTFLSIAGESELARWVRPSTRKTGQTIELVGEEDPSSELPSAGPQPTGGSV